MASTDLNIKVNVDVPEEAAKVFLQFVELYLANNVDKKVV